MNEDIIYSSMPNQYDITNLPRWQLDLEAELDKFKLSLLGMVVNEGKGFKDENGFLDLREYIPLPGANLVNERGATAIHNKLRAELTKIPSDTNFDEAVISIELMAFESDFSYWLAVNHVAFELSDKDYNTICESAVRLVKGAYYRSLGGWKGELINNNTQQREVIQSTNTEIQQQKPKIFGFMGR